MTVAHHPSKRTAMKIELSHRLCQSSALTLLLGAALAGCAPLAAPIASAPRPATPRTEPARTSVGPSVSASVQVLPEYARARAACGLGRYRQAAQILARLEQSPALSAEQRAFCRTQEQICLGHLAPPA